MLEGLSHAVDVRVNVKKKETTCSIKTGFPPSFLSFLALGGHMESTLGLSSVHQKSL